MDRDDRERLAVEGDWVFAVSPEGQRSAMRVPDLVALLAPPEVPGRLCLPEGSRAALPLPRGFAVVWEAAPRVWPFRWIAPDSPRRFGPGTRYREVRLALPYVLVLAVFETSPHGGFALSGANECFFRNARLRSMEDEVRYPALLNCSKFADPEGHPLSWICTQHLDLSDLASDGSSPDALVERSLRRLVTHLFDSGFNESSDVHEGASWFSETVRSEVDARIRSVETWHDATAADPCFAIEVDWLPTGRTLRQVLDRIAAQQSPSPARVRSGGDLARLVFDHGRTGGPP
jgi:hypothetical protein